MEVPGVVRERGSTIQQADAATKHAVQQLEQAYAHLMRLVRGCGVPAYHAHASNRGMAATNSSQSGNARWLQASIAYAQAPYRS